MVILENAQSEIFIVAKVNEEIITNLDVDFEKRYLVSLNPNLKKLDKKRITEYAKDSLINERIKKIEIQKRFEFVEVVGPWKRTPSCFVHGYTELPVRLHPLK